MLRPLKPTKLGPAEEDGGAVPKVPFQLKHANEFGGALAEASQAGDRACAFGQPPFMTTIYQRIRTPQNLM